MTNDIHLGSEPPSFVSEVTELEHCPFCGYLDVDFVVKPDPMGRICTASCGICGASVSGMGVMAGDASYDALKESAVVAWNRRSEPRDDDGSGD